MPDPADPSVAAGVAFDPALRQRVASRRSHRTAAGMVLLVVIGVLWFGFLGLRALYFPDEGRYAEIPREMVASGDWITPRLNTFPYFEKPPLQYWITAAAFAIFGEHDWTARLWPAISGLAAVLGVLLTGRRLYSRRAGWLAAAIMASSVGYFVATQFLTLDMGLAALLIGAMCAFAVAQDARATATQTRQWMLVAWALAALAVMSKGLIGVVLPILAVGVYVVASRSVGVLRRLHPVAGLAIMLAITVPWFVVMELRNPGFSDFFFIHEHLQRFTQPEHRRPGPWWYFLPIGAMAMMPWLPAMVTSMRRPRATLLARPDGEFNATLFFWCWTGAILVFFSVSASKLPAYILPAMGAVVLAVAVPLARQLRTTLRITAATAMVSGALIALTVFPATSLIKVPQVAEDFREHVGWLVGAGVVYALTGIAAWGLVARRRVLAALAVLVVGGMLTSQVALVMAHAIDEYFSAERLMARVTAGVRPYAPTVPFYSVDMFDHTVPFLLGRTVILVKEQSELSYGIAAAPDNYIPTVDAFIARWRQDKDAFAVMPPNIYEWLLGAGIPMRLVDGDGRRVVVSRR
ncbi:MAG: glycosyltransferase family 39 protein [Betaproteobacteria bacterium]